MSPTISRRRVLASTATAVPAAAFAGCTSVGDGDPEVAPESPPTERRERARGDPIEHRGDPTELPDWACPDAARDAVAESIAERMGPVLDELAPVVRPSPESDGEVHVALELVHVVDRDGELVEAPSTTFEEVLAAAPETVTVELRDGERDLGCVLDVFVHRTVEREG